MFNSTWMVLSKCWVNNITLKRASLCLIIIILIFKGSRELKFFNGKSIGPINRRFIYNSDDEAVAIQLSIENDSFYSYLNGGCYFLAHENIVLDSFKTIATYDSPESGNRDELLECDSKIAIVECNFGDGKCLLSGVHFEIDAHSLDLCNQNIRMNVFDKLSSNRTNEHSNHALVKYLLQKVFKIS